jgi:hypothetical protein
VSRDTPARTLVQIRIWDFEKQKKAEHLIA